MADSVVEGLRLLLGFLWAGSVLYSSERSTMLCVGTRLWKDAARGTLRHSNRTPKHCHGTHLRAPTLAARMMTSGAKACGDKPKH